MMSRYWKAALIGYAAMAVFSFGWQANYAQEAIESAQCDTSEKRLNSRAYCYHVPAIEGFAAGVLWPLYWSWELQS